MCMVSGHRVVPGLQTPPQVIPTHALGHVMVAPHWPSLPQVSVCVLLMHFFAPGTQMPPQVLPTQAFVQGLAAPHCPLALQV